MIRKQVIMEEEVQRHKERIARMSKRIECNAIRAVGRKTSFSPAVLGIKTVSQFPCISLHEIRTPAKGKAPLRRSVSNGDVRRTSNYQSPQGYRNDQNERGNYHHGYQHLSPHQHNTHYNTQHYGGYSRSEPRPSYYSQGYNRNYNGPSWNGYNQHRTPTKPSNGHHNVTPRKVDSSHSANFNKTPGSKKPVQNKHVSQKPSGQSKNSVSAELSSKPVDNRKPTDSLPNGDQQNEAVPVVQSEISSPPHVEQVSLDDCGTIENKADLEEKVNRTFVLEDEEAEAAENIPHSDIAPTILISDVNQSGLLDSVLTVETVEVVTTDTGEEGLEIISEHEELDHAVEDIGDAEETSDFELVYHNVSREIPNETLYRESPEETLPTLPDNPLIVISEPQETVLGNPDSQPPTENIDAITSEETLPTPSEKQTEIVSSIESEETLPIPSENSSVVSLEPRETVTGNSCSQPPTQITSSIGSENNDVTSKCSPLPANKDTGDFLVSESCIKDITDDTQKPMDDSVDMELPESCIEGKHPTEEILSENDSENIEQSRSRQISITIKTPVKENTHLKNKEVDTPLGIAEKFDELYITPARSARKSRVLVDTTNVVESSSIRYVVREGKLKDNTCDVIVTPVRRSTRKKVKSPSHQKEISPDKLVDVKIVPNPFLP